MYEIEKYLEFESTPEMEQAMINKDYVTLGKFLEESSSDYFLLMTREHPGYMADRNLSPAAAVSITYAINYPLSCGWSAEALRHLFFKSSKTNIVRRALAELEAAGYAEKVYKGDENGKFARYILHEESKTPEKRRYICERHIDSQEDKSGWEEASALAGRPLAEDEVLIILKSAYGAVKDHRIAKIDKDFSFYGALDKELIRRPDVSVAEVIYL